MLTLNDPRINPADFELIEYSRPQGKRKDKVFVPCCRVLPQFRKPRKQYEHVEIPIEYYERLQKGL